MKNCMWAVKDKHGNLTSVRRTKREAIADAVSCGMPWKWFRKWGYRPVKVMVTAVQAKPNKETDDDSANG